MIGKSLILALAVCLILTVPIACQSPSDKLREIGENTANRGTCKELVYNLNAYDKAVVDQFYTDEAIQAGATKDEAYFINQGFYEACFRLLNPAH